MPLQFGALCAPLSGTCSGLGAHWSPCTLCINPIFTLFRAPKNKTSSREQYQKFFYLPHLGFFLGSRELLGIYFQSSGGPQSTVKIIQKHDVCNTLKISLNNYPYFLQNANFNYYFLKSLKKFNLQNHHKKSSN